MSTFRRPKKPIRPRVVALHQDSDENENGDQMEVDSDVPPPKSSNNNGLIKDKDKKKEDKDKPSLLSFDDDLDGEDGEVFQVKKSSVSRRLMKQKQRDKEKRGDKDKPLGLTTSTSTTSSASASKSTPKIKEDKDDFIRILNGREAEAVHAEEEDDLEDDDQDPEDPDEDESRHKFKFRRPLAGSGGIQDAVRRALEQGQIPDANLIHEARKRKQMAREQGGGNAPDFIPVDNVNRFKSTKSRLIREDDDNDNEESDEERIDFSSATNAHRIDRERRIEDFNAARDEDSDADADSELEEWESQQIRKGVSQVKIQNVIKGQMFKLYPEQDKEAYVVDKQEPVRKGRTQTFMEQTQKIASIEEIVSGSKKITLDMVLKQMSDRLDRLRISRDSNAGELSRIEADLNLALKELDETEDFKAGLNDRFILYQNLGGYVTDLTDCLQHKVPEIEALEDRMIDLMKQRRDKFTERRRQDVSDQRDEVTATISIMGGTQVIPPPPPNPERTRRAAEREGRRTRRRRMREKEMKDSISHKDGLSSDDEEPDLEFKAYCASRGNMLGQVSQIFDEVHEDFATVGGILSRFEEWRDNDFDAYKESYAYMCLPKCLAPLIRLELISWDPLRENYDFFKQPWMKALISYSYKKGERLEDLAKSPDCRLIPSVIEKTVLLWIKRIIDSRWDPMSGSQTRQLVNVVNRLIDDFSISPSNKPMHSVLETVIARLRETVDNDVYIPMFPETVVSNSFSPASVFLSRQFWSSVKLLDNMSKFQGLLNDRPLQALALDALLTRYSLMGVRIASDLPERVERGKGIVNVLPRAWLSRDNGIEVPNGLNQLCRTLVSLCQSADCTIAANRLAIPEAANLLKTLGFYDEAQAVLRKYS